MKKCFVVMPIGDQSYDGQSISSKELKEKYSDLIKESIKSVSEDIEVIRGVSHLLHKMKF